MGFYLFIYFFLFPIWPIFGLEMHMYNGYVEIRDNALKPFLGKTNSVGTEPLKKLLTKYDGGVM